MVKVVRDISNWIYYSNAVRNLKKMEGWELLKIKQDFFGRLYTVVNISEPIPNNKLNPSSTQVSQRETIFNSQLIPMFTFIKMYDIPLSELIRVEYKDINTFSRLYIFEPTFERLTFGFIKFMIRFIILFLLIELVLFFTYGIKFFIINLIISKVYWIYSLFM